MKIIALLLFFTTLTAGVQDHFKVVQKTPGHSMRNIDFIYVLNLDKRPEKFARCKEQLAPYGIDPFRFSAVNGWEDLSLETINDVGVIYESWMPKEMWGTYYPLNGDGTGQHEIMHVVGKNYFSHCMSKGAIAINLSHLSILQDAYDSGYETIWVMEDDIDVVKNPHDLSTYIDQMDTLVGRGRWDILFTDPDTKNNENIRVPCRYFAPRPNYSPSHPKMAHVNKPISPQIRQIGARFGAYSMIIRRSGMKKILDFLKTYKIFFPYDMEYCLPNDIKLYTMMFDVVSTKPNSPSDNGEPGYLKR